MSPTAAFFAFFVLKKVQARTFVVVRWEQREGPRFCTGSPSDHTFKNHGDKKANVKPGHVCLGSESSERSTGWLGWCMPVEVFGGRKGQLLALCLDGLQFRRFGETLQGLHSSGKVGMSSVN